MGIPNLNEYGELPAGEHPTTLEQIKNIFGQHSDQRQKLMRGLLEAVKNLKAAGVRKVWIDGSFVTSKEEPNDIDGCWEYNTSVDLQKIDSVFLMRSRALMKEKYGVEFFPSSILEGASGLPFPRFFQINREGEAKGILVVSLEVNDD